MEKTELNALTKVKQQYNALPDADKRLLKMYTQMPLEDILKRANQFAELVQTHAEEPKRQKEFLKQATLYQIAYIFKEKGLMLGGKRKSRKQKQKRKHSRSRKSKGKERK
jgi:hypothetical protein